VSDRRKLIVVSNRGPLAFARDAGGERVAQRGAGGLVTALAPLVSHHDVTWIASALSDEDRAVAAEGAVDETARDGSRYRLRLVAHPPSAYDLYYNVVANPALWFVQHGLWGLKQDPQHDLGCAWEEGYVAVNQAFANAVLEELERQPAATVFLHDYHLYVAPALVRAQQPEAVLAHFTHIPWVDAEAWSVLPPPIVTAIHTGLLANDVVGFHTERWRDAFLSACSSLGLDTGDALVTAHPISIDPDEFTGLSRSDAVLARERELVASRPETMILRVDRTDPSKNVVRGFEAFGLLLERRPDLRGRVGMLALLDPSRQEIPEYVEELHHIHAAAAAVEGRFPGALELRVSDDFPQSVAAYKQFDVLLVNAVMDGLNLVAKEAPIVNTRDGVVVLSVNAGAHEELGEWTVPIDPLDVQGQATALEDAISLPRDERRSRLEAIQEHVRSHDLVAWIEAQLADIDRASTMRRRL
jgi:trehalose 6-phosphate synthase